MAHHSVGIATKRADGIDMAAARLCDMVWQISKEYTSVMAHEQQREERENAARANGVKKCRHD